MLGLVWLRGYLPVDQCRGNDSGYRHLIRAKTPKGRWYTKVER